MNDPIEKFERWWQQSLLNSPLQQKSAVCVSTINKQGFPEGRFVDLKSVSDHGFTFCTYLDSSKGNDIRRNSKVSLTMWWEHVGYQVRIVGTAQQISDIEASKYWQTRNRDAQLTTMSFAQSKPLSSEAELAEKFKLMSKELGSQPVPKPENWGGYIVSAVTIEFLTFKQNRLHFRELFQRHNGQWHQSLLQP